MTDSLSIKLNSGSKSILKIGFLLRALILLITIIGAALTGINVFKEMPLLGIICLAVSIGVLIILYNMLKAAFYSESLLITKQTITVIYKTQGNTTETSFHLDDIRYFGFFQQHYTKHPMDTNPFIDVTGLAVLEKELQYVIDEGNIKIETATKSMRFGKNMPSWDVEELVEEIENFTGLKFKTPIPQRTEEHARVDKDEDLQEEELSTFPENESETPQNFTRKTYKGDYGSLTIEQKLDIPSSEDRAFLNGKLAASGKYQVGDKQFVLVSNGIIYAVRGFSE
ncbi:hypothetical protein CNR22_02250 [Sphingobacteriaceae bacterium]|nr:hypothetical protein CNR22_02250 [Sphingobacteriaceae bacterium]